MNDSLLALDMPNRRGVVRPKALIRRLGMQTPAFRAALAAGLLATILHVGVDALRLHAHRMERAGDAARVAAQMSARLIDADIAERTQQVVAQVGQMRTLKRSDLGPQLRVLAASTAAYSWIGVADRDGRVLASNDGLLVGADVSARDWFRHGGKALWHGDVHEALMLSSLMQLRSDGEPWRFVDVALPLHGKDFHGVLGAHLSWPWLQARMRALEPALPPGSELMIVGADDKVIGAPVHTPALMAGSLARARLGGAGWMVESWPDQVDGVTGFAMHTGAGSFPGLAWVTLVRVPVEPWGAKADLHLLREFLVCACLAVLAAGALSATSRRARPSTGTESGAGSQP